VLQLKTEDFNAKSQLWDSPSEDASSKLLADLITNLDMSICNWGTSPAFVRGHLKSFIDITFASNTIRGRIDNWKVLDNESLSLHRYISFSLSSLLSRSHSLQTPIIGWSTRTMNGDLLTVSLLTNNIPPCQPLSVEAEAENLVGWITQAADKCLPKRWTFSGKHPVPW